jgi:hypothetical protein
MAKVPVETWELILESIRTTSTLADDSYNLTPDSPLWSAFTKNMTLGACTSSQLCLNSGQSLTTDARLSQLVDTTLLQSLFKTSNTILVQFQMHTTIPGSYTIKRHNELCLIPSSRAARGAMRTVRDSIHTAMARARPGRRGRHFILPYSLRLDCTVATCACGSHTLATKDIVGPLVKMRSGT